MPQIFKLRGNKENTLKMHGMYPTSETISLANSTLLSNQLNSNTKPYLFYNAVWVFKAVGMITRVQITFTYIHVTLKQPIIKDGFSYNSQNNQLFELLDQATDGGLKVHRYNLINILLSSCGIQRYHHSYPLHF